MRFLCNFCGFAVVGNQILWYFCGYSLVTLGIVSYCFSTQLTLKLLLRLVLQVLQRVEEMLCGCGGDVVVILWYFCGNSVPFSSGCPFALFTYSNSLWGRLQFRPMWWVGNQPCTVLAMLLDTQGPEAPASQAKSLTRRTPPVRPRPVGPWHPPNGGMGDSPSTLLGTGVQACIASATEGAGMLLECCDNTVIMLCQSSWPFLLHPSPPTAPTGGGYWEAKGLGPLGGPP